MSDKSELFEEHPATPLTPGMSMTERRKALKERVQRHVDHLDALVRSLKELGVDSAAIDARVAEVFEQYKTQLLRNIDLTGRVIGGQKNAARNLPQERPDPASKR